MNDFQFVVENRGGLAAHGVTVALALAGEWVAENTQGAVDLGTVPAAGRSSPARFPIMVQGRRNPGPLEGTVTIGQSRPFEGLRFAVTGVSVVARDARIEEVAVGPSLGAPSTGAGLAGAPGVQVTIVKPLQAELATVEPTLPPVALAQDPTGIASWRVLVNGEAVRTEELRGVSGVVQGGGAQPSSSRKPNVTIELAVPLRVGRNAIEVEATNAGGRSGESAAIVVTRRAPAANVYVLVVGINDYADERIPDLRFAEADARRVHDFFASDSGSPARTENCAILTGADADREGILVAIEEILAERASEDDAVIFYYSGHGDRDVSGEEYSLVPQNARKGRFRSTAIELSDLQRVWSGIRARTKVFIADSCNEGGLSALRSPAASKPRGREQT